MKTNITFIENDTGKRSDCGDPLEIEVSSRNLPWEGVLLEKGWSPHFMPHNIVTPCFYFALAIESRFTWTAEHRGEFVDLKTNPGEIWMNPPRVPFTHVINEPCYFIILTVDEDALYRHFEGVLPGDKLQFLQNYNVHDTSLEYFIRLFSDEARIGGKNGAPYFQNMLKLFSLYFVRNYSNYGDLMSRKAPGARIKDGDMAKITLFIDDNIEGVISIEDLAEICGMSKFYFLKEFKKQTGITPYQYILRTKLEKSRELLKRQDIQIVDVAYRLGFSDQSHFTNSFKKHFGYSPREFKAAE